MTDKKLNIELKPCPFCGDKPLIKRDRDDGSLSIECPNCSKSWNGDDEASEKWAADFGFYGWDESSDSAVIAAWNRRAADRPTCEDVSDFDHEAFKCSRCGHRVLSLGGDSCDAVVVSPDGLISEYYYCPNCGKEVVE